MSAFAVAWLLFALAAIGVGMWARVQSPSLKIDKKNLTIQIYVPDSDPEGVAESAAYFLDDGPHRPPLFLSDGAYAVGPGGSEDFRIDSRTAGDGVVCKLRCKRAEDFPRLRELAEYLQPPS